MNGNFFELAQCEWIVRDLDVSGWLISAKRVLLWLRRRNICIMDFIFFKICGFSIREFVICR